MLNMKKLFFPVLFFIALIIILPSCKSTHVGGYSALPKLTIDYNLKADLKIDTTKTLQGTSTTTTYFNLISVGDNSFSDAFGGNIGDREKSAATFKALDGTGYDIIVNPKYMITVEKRLFISKITATVGGYGAKLYIK